MKQKYPYIIILIFCLFFFEGRGQLNLNGVIEESEWILLGTSDGGPFPSFGSGHEINALYWQLDEDYLYFAIAGDVQDGNSIILFIDTEEGGYGTANYGRNSAPAGINNLNDGINFNGNFVANYAIRIGSFEGNYFLDLYTLSGTAGSGGGPSNFLGDANSNELGADPLNSNQTRGFEFRIPKSEINFDETHALKAFAMYAGDSGFLSNQFITRANLGQGDFGNGSVNFDSEPPSFVNLEIISLDDGDYTVASNWNILKSPDLNGSRVTINSDITLNANAQLSSITINSSHTLTFEDTQERELIMLNGGNLTNNGSIVANDGTLIFSGSGSISGAATTNLYNLEINGGVNVGSSTTMANECVMKSGSFFSDNAPLFLENSSLVYDTGGNYNRGIEWNNSTTTDQGTPHNVEVRSGTFQMNGTGFTSGTATILGDLLITGGSFNMNGFTLSDVEANNIIVNGGAIEIGDTSFDGGSSGRSLVANGDFRNLDGNVTLGTGFQGDLKVRGTELIYLTEDSSFNSQGRAVIFEGNNEINVTSTGEIVIDFVVIDMEGGKVVVDNDLTIQGLSGTGGESGILLHMLDQATLDLNGFDLFLGDNSNTENFDVVMEEDTQIISTPTTTITILNNGDTQLRLDESQQGETNAVKKLIVENKGKTIISNDLHIFESLDVDEAEVDGNDKLIFRSNENQTAVITEIKNNGSVTGNIRVERYFSDANRSFRYVSSPVNSTEDIRANWQEGQNNTSTSSNSDTNQGFGTHITGSTDGSNGFDATQTGNPSLFTYDNATESWEAIPNTNNTNLVLGQAYALMVRGSRSTDLTDNNSQGGETILRSFGELHVGDFEVPNLPASAEAYTLIGNPYQAQVNLKEVDFSDFNTNHVWIWDPSFGGSGGYTTIDLTQDPVVTTPTSDANELLQAGQAFFIETSGTSPSISFRETHKSEEVNNTATFSSPSPNILVNLSREELGVIDATRVVFGEEFSNEVTLEDAVKFWANDEYIAIEKNEKWLSVEKKPLQENDTIQLFTGNYLNSEYQLTIESLSTEEAEVFLIDNYLETSTEINSENFTYSFEVDQGISESVASTRFQLVVNPIPMSSQDFSSLKWKIYPNPVRGNTLNIEVTQIYSDTANIQLFNQLGQKVFETEEAYQSQLELRIPNLPKGIYMINFKANEQSWNDKIIVE